MIQPCLTIHTHHTTLFNPMPTKVYDAQRNNQYSAQPTFVQIVSKTMYVIT